MPIKLTTRQRLRVYFLGFILLLLPVTTLADQVTNSAENELIDAASRGQLSRMRSLLTESHSFLQPTLNQALIQATLHGQDKVVEFLLNNNANINAQDEENRPLLHLAARDDRIAALRVLLAKGANKDAVTVDGTTALMIAAQYHRIEILRLLIQAGADINVGTQEESPHS